MHNRTHVQPIPEKWIAHYQAVRAITASLDPAVVLEQLAVQLHRLFPAEGAAAYLVNIGGKYLERGGVSGVGEEDASSIPLSDPLRAVLSGGITSLDAVTGWCGFTPPSVVRALTLVPFQGNHAVGLLVLYARSPIINTPEQVWLLSAVAEQAGIALENSFSHYALQKSERQRAQFVHIVTHELRSPVVGAQSLVRVLLQGLAGDLTPQQTDIIDRLSKRMDSLLVLINDLLVLAASKTLPDESALVRLELQAVLRSAAEDHRFIAEEKQIALHLELPVQPVYVRGAAEGLLRIFENLIGNAVKYTRANGSVTVSLWTEGNRVITEVKDTGIGIPQAALPQIGTEFFRASNARESGIVGTGLGMAAVKSLITNYGGMLHIASVEGEGSTFTVNLPYDPIPL